MRSRNRPLFHAEWLNAVFLHFRVDANALQPFVPLELDRFDGDAYVSLVAFTQARLRPAVGERYLEWLSAPLARHEFLNLRTYVRTGETRGIYFLAEWIPNRLAVLIGPRMYGLPYRLGRLQYANDARFPEMHGIVDADGGELAYRAMLQSREFKAVLPKSLDHFLVERYTAFTSRNGIVRRFDVSHEPWPISRLDAKITTNALIQAALPICSHWNSPDLAHFSPGVYDVGISAPARSRPDTFRRPEPSKPQPA